MTRRVLITGADGFIGRNLKLALKPRGDWEVIPVTRQAECGSTPRDWRDLVTRADAIVHLAGTNRTDDPAAFSTGNTELTRQLAEAVAATGRPTPVIFASSTQAALDNAYGISKREAEDVLRRNGEAAGYPVYVFRLPNVFGKWARPNYNSAVATFCHNIARDLPITIHDPAAPLSLVYIDDVIAAFISILDGARPASDEIGCTPIAPIYQSTVGDVAAMLADFRALRDNHTIGPVGTGLARALYATYVSYLSADDFAYSLPVHSDPRGVFVEMLRTRASGQFSFFTAHPGVTRGGHYHHSKTEKFLVLSGTARFGFRHMDTGEIRTLIVHGGQPQVVDTIPGWTHDITNIGDDPIVVMLWANELFDPARPDTFACPVDPIPGEAAAL